MIRFFISYIFTVYLFNVINRYISPIKYLSLDEVGSMMSLLVVWLPCGAQSSVPDNGRKKHGMD